jgi:hypothetical protein
MGALGQDLKLALRMLGKSPGNAAGLSAHAGARHRGQHRHLQRRARLPGNVDLILDFLHWAETQKSFEALGAIRGHNYNLTGAGPPERLEARMMIALRNE